MSTNVYVGLGSNEGDREGRLVAALEALSRIDAVAVLRHSSLFESAPVGPSQPPFLNAVVALDCGLSPQRLLTILQRIEHDLGRRRRWGALGASPH
nr:2-amino-4-hydroxy-6-hydroxymethyldihydropteridine diphosphokinase [Stigmatella aurantiaca]